MPRNKRDGNTQQIITDVLHQRLRSPKVIPADQALLWADYFL